MADIRATKNGNWSDATVWTPNPPAAGDVVRPNNFTVTIDVNVTVTEIRNDAGGGAVANGGFVVNTGGLTITATNGFYLGGNTNLLTVSTSATFNGLMNHFVNNNFVCLDSTTAGLITVNGDLIKINTSTVGRVIRHFGTGQLIVNGNVTFGSAAFGNGSVLENTNIGTVIINGNITSNAQGGVNQTPALLNSNLGTITVNGNILAISGIGISNSNIGVININGVITNNLSGGSPICVVNGAGTANIIGDITLVSSVVNTAPRVLVNGNGVMNVTGNVNGFSTTSNFTSTSIENTGSGIINITGVIQGIIGGTLAATINAATIMNTNIGTINITGTVNSGSFTNTIKTYATVSNLSNGSINIIGNCQSGGAGIAILNRSSGAITINGNGIGGASIETIRNESVGTITVNGNAIGGTAYQAIEGVNAAGNTIVEKIRFGANGQTATRGYIKFKNTPNIAAEIVLKTDATTTNLVDINVVPNLQPAISDVRLGVTYSSGSLTGTMNVPPFNAVKAGVPVDNGVGTAALTPQDVWNVLISGLTQSGSIGERLKNVATVETTGTQIASFNV